MNEEVERKQLPLREVALKLYGMEIESKHVFEQKLQLLILKK